MKTIKGTTGPGDTCPWCGAPGTVVVIVEPARTRKTKGGHVEILDLAVYAKACAEHAHIAAGGGSAAHPRRRDAPPCTRHRAARPARRRRCRPDRRHPRDRVSAA